MSSQEPQGKAFIGKIREHIITQGFRRGAQVSKELQAEILQHQAEIREQINTLLGNIPDSARHPLVRHLALTTLEKDKPRSRHQLALTALDPNGKKLWEELSNTAQELAEALEGITYTKEEIQTLLLLNALLNSRDLNESKILRVNGNEKRFSPKDIFEIWKQISTSKTKDPIERSLKFCRELGLFKETSDETAKEIIRERKNDAWKFLEHIMQEANDTLAEYADDTATKDHTNENIDELGISHRLQAMSLFEWVTIMFDRNENERIRLEAQLLLKFALEFHNIENSPAYKGSRQLKQEASAQVQNIITTTKHPDYALYNRLKFQKNGWIINPEDERRKIQVPTREIQIEGFDEFKKKAIFISFDDKSAEATLIKLLTKDPDMNPQEIRDCLRCTLVIPDVTFADIDRCQRAREYFYAIGEACGKQMGLQYRALTSITDENPLKVGEFTIEDNLAGPQQLFRNVKLLGIIPNRNDQDRLGTTLEIQINTIDLYEIIKGSNSPFGHEDYEGLRWVAVTYNTLPENLYPQAIPALAQKERRIVSRRSSAIESSHIYIEERTRS